MDRNPYVAPEFSVERIPSLGSVVFQCRVRSEMEKVAARGQSTLTVHLQAFLVPIFLLLMLAGLLSNILYPGKEIKPEFMSRLFLPGGLIYLSYLGVWYWFLYRKPRWRGLAYLEHGLRFQRHAFRFSDIVSIRSGRTLSDIEQAGLVMNRFLGKFRFINRRAAMNEHAAAMIELYQMASLTITTKQGGIWPLRAVAIDCEPVDFKKLFEMIATHHPEIALEVDSTTGPFDPSTRTSPRTDSFFDGSNPKISQL